MPANLPKQAADLPRIDNLVLSRTRLDRAEATAADAAAWPGRPLVDAQRTWHSRHFMETITGR